MAAKKTKKTPSKKATTKRKTAAKKATTKRKTAAKKAPKKKSKPHGGEFSAAELAKIKAKVRHLRTEVIGPVVGTAAKLANARRAIVDMERHLDGLERDRKEVRAFLRSSKQAAAAAKKRPRRRRS